MITHRRESVFNKAAVGTEVVSKASKFKADPNLRPVNTRYCLGPVVLLYMYMYIQIYIILYIHIYIYTYISYYIIYIYDYILYVHIHIILYMCIHVCIYIYIIYAISEG